MHIGSDVHVDRSWGSVTVHRRWGCVDRRSNRSKVEEKLTGSAVRWARCDQSGGLAFASQWWIDRRSLRSGGFAFGTLADQRFVRWSAFRSQVWSAFGSVSLSLVANDLSLSLRLVVCFRCFGWVCFFHTYGNRLKVKQVCKMISGSTSVNFGQTKIIFRKIYFP